MSADNRNAFGGMEKSEGDVDGAVDSASDDIQSRIGLGPGPRTAGKMPTAGLPDDSTIHREGCSGPLVVEQHADPPRRGGTH